MNVSSDSDSFPKNMGTGTPGLNTRGRANAAAKKTSIQIPRPAQLLSTDSPPPPAINIDVAEESIDARMTERLRRNRKSLSSMMASFIFHALWIAVLFYLASPTKKVPKPIAITATIESVANDSPLETFTPAEIITKVEQPFESPIDDTQQSLAEAVDPAAAQPETVAIPKVAIQPVLPTVASTDARDAADAKTARITGGGIEGRDPKSRAAIAAARGGSPQSEAAVEAGLRWIVEHQNRYDGGWSFQQQCKQCRHDGRSQSDNAATGLSLMALLGAGYTHRAGPYQESVQNGLDVLLRYQDRRKSEFGGPFVDVSAAGMYTHAICTIAIADAYAMTKDPKLEEPLRLAHQYILNAQHSEGGWRYRPNSRGDMLVTGWQVMALKSLQRCGIETPADVYDATIAFVESLQQSNGSEYRYYFTEARSSNVATAVGLLNQMYLQWPKDHPSLDFGANNLIDRRVSKDDIYFNFYTTLLLHHLQHDGWEYWNEAVRERLIKTQAKRGHETGSWHFKHKHGDVGGRLYTTAMAVMTLEVYYRYSPLFGSDDDLTKNPTQ
jgi:hypothetical protein